jgi:ATP-binding cassette subfamily F protein 3
MISINQLSVDFGGFSLFENISFLINPKDRIGLIGKNGAGKSTLLKILAGQMQPTAGEVTLPNGVRIGYLPQHINCVDTRGLFEEVETAFTELKEIENRLAIIHHKLETLTDFHSEEYSRYIHQLSDLNERYDLLGGGNYRAKIEQTLRGLGFERNDFTRMTAEFSGGWRMRIELAKILLQQPDIFLLDEPTNHLDIESIQWLEDFLKTYQGAVLLISHDKAFLNQITTRTIEISLGRIYDYKASYDKFLELRAERRQQQLAAYTNQQKMIDDTEKFIERFRYKSSKSIQVQSRIKHLEKLDRIEVDELDTSGLNIKFPPAPRSGTIVVEGKGIHKRYGSHEVLCGVDFQIKRGDKVAFVGRNGEGKTTLARIIMNEIDYEGELKLGHNVEIGYFAQNQAERLDEQLTVFDTVDRVAVGDIRTKLRNLLGAFLFSGEDVEKKVAVLSGGERTRLAMVLMLLKPSGFLILDEPTNHLDMRSKDLLKQALIDFEGTVLLVSHDREFLDGLVTKTYEFRNKNIKEHLGGIYEFLQSRRIDSLVELEKKELKNPQVKMDIAEPANKGKQSFDERKEFNKKLKKAQKNIEDSEHAIANLENELAHLQQLLNIPENASDMSLFERYTNTQKQLDTEMERWEEFHQELELLENQKQ